MATETRLRQLADKGCPVYYFYSSERYLVRQAVAAATRILTADSDEDATILDGGAPEIEQLIMAAGTISIIDSVMVLIVFMFPLFFMFSFFIWINVLFQVSVPVSFCVVCVPRPVGRESGDTCFGRKDMKNIVWFKGFFGKVWGRGNYKLCIILPLTSPLKGRGSLSACGNG